MAFVAVVYHAPSFGVVGADDFAAGQDVGRAVPARAGGYGIVCVFAFGLQVVGQPLGNLPPASSRLIWLPLKRVVERPFFAEVVAAFKHFAVGVVTVVFVAGHQSVGLAVLDHDVVAVGKTAQFFAVASVNGGQIAVAVVVVAHQFLAVEGDGGEAVDVETFVFGNEDVPFSGRVEVGTVVVVTEADKPT